MAVKSKVKLSPLWLTVQDIIMWTQTQHCPGMFHSAWKPQGARNNCLCVKGFVSAQIQNATFPDCVEQERI